MVWDHSGHWMVTGEHAGFVKYWQNNMNNVKMYQAHKDAVRGIRLVPRQRLHCSGNTSCKAQTGEIMCRAISSRTLSALTCTNKVEVDFKQRLSSINFYILLIIMIINKQINYGRIKLIVYAASFGVHLAYELLSNEENTYSILHDLCMCYAALEANGAGNLRNQIKALPCA